MRVGIDVTGLFWKYKTGVQNLYYGLFEGLAGLDDSSEYILIDRSVDVHSIPADQSKYLQIRRTMPAHLPLITQVLPGLEPGIRLWNRGITGLASRLTNRPDALNKVLGDLDVFHVWTWNICRAPKAKHVITLTDVIPIIFANWFAPDFVQSTKRGLAFAKDEAEHVIAISQFTKQEIIRVGGLDENRISVAYPGVRSIFRPMDKSLSMNVAKRYGIGANPYILSLGYIDPRKNVLGHVRAFEILAKEKAFRDFQFVLVGPESFSSNQVLTDIQSTHIRERIHVTGYLSDEDTVALMNGASAFVYCSLYEGFGFPILEAMACGIPVITSNTTSLAEIGRNAAVLVDPENPNEIANAFSQVLQDEELRADLRVQGIEHAQHFTWQKFAQEHLQIYKHAYINNQGALLGG
jgi:glycosyltransferase involved in cell wall biosynthesis